VRTRHLQSVTHEHSVTIKNKSDVLSPFGPVRAGLTTSQTTPKVQLMELLNSLERKVATLVSKSSTLCDTLNTVTQEVSAVLSNTQIDGAGTDADRC